MSLGFIPLFMAYEYIKNRDKYCWEYFVIALAYLISMPMVYVDFIYGNFGELDFLMQRTLIPTLYRGVLFVSGMFLMIKGLQIPYNIIIKKVRESKEKQ